MHFQIGKLCSWETSYFRIVGKVVVEVVEELAREHNSCDDESVRSQRSEDEIRVFVDDARHVVHCSDETSRRAKDVLGQARDVVTNGNGWWFERVKNGHCTRGSGREGVAMRDVNVQQSGKNCSEGVRVR